MLKTDVLIIGSEGVGARAAIAAQENGANVLIVTKGRMGKSGATVTAVAGFAIGGRAIRDVLGLPGDTEDSPEAFFEDIILEGKHINNQKLVELVVDEGPLRIKELMDWGMKLRAHDSRIGGHRFSRCVSTSGRQIINTLKRKVKQYGGIRVIEDMMVTDLLTLEGQVIGAVGLDLRKGEFVVISAKAVMLATGGGQMVYPIQTAPEELTGDGQSMAYRAGAELIDMEMVQYHPCNFISPPAWKGIGFPFTIGPGGGLRNTWLLNKWGERFMDKWDPERMENSTRDTLSIAIMTEVLEGRGSPHGGAFLSFAHLPQNLIDYFGEWFHLLGPDWHFGGFKFKNLIEDVKKGYAIEVVPACHFFMGGIRINENCETNLAGLFAIGEVAGGCHGANRLSDVALTEIFVHGAIGGKEAALYAKKTEHTKVNVRQVKELEGKLLQPLLRKSGISPFEVKKRIQDLAWQKAGVIRTSTSLTQALEEIQRIKTETLPQINCKAKEREYNREWMEAIQLENLLTTLECITQSALLRTESRGAHYRKDSPEIDNKHWLQDTILQNVGGQMRISQSPVVVTRWAVPEEAEN